MCKVVFKIRTFQLECKSERTLCIEQEEKQKKKMPSYLFQSSLLMDIVNNNPSQI